jgi:hypothetical protein
MFRTLTTSQGIKEIISLSASYFNSLDPEGGKDTTQKLIRPRFLQMIVLLLSLLNDEDLSDIADFLEATYKLKAERKHLELLFLKVIPLMSINSTVFLKAMIPAIEGFPLNDDYDSSNEVHAHCWDVFVRRILEQGYILPGSVLDLGREEFSVQSIPFTVILCSLLSPIFILTFLFLLSRNLFGIPNDMWSTAIVTNVDSVMLSGLLNGPKMASSPLPYSTISNTTAANSGPSTK